MSIGVCYFPEHWPRDRWEEDVQEMADAGLEYVRMGEFAWSRIEPQRGEFDLEWLEAAVDLVGEYGMQAVLCTPTATPPKWLVDERPEILQEEADGTVRDYGSRRHYCFNSPAYREETRRIVSKLANHFADNPYVTGWQTDNEFGCHGTVRCYCDDCATEFRDWLRDRYDSINDLNETWGTTFWSQHLTGFHEIDPPRETPAGHHPSRLLEYHRFASDSVVAYNRLQADILREHNDEWFVTHNFMGQFPDLDAFDVAEDLDLVSWDSYPTGSVQAKENPTVDEYRAGDPRQVGLSHDLYRGALGKPFWVMEQQPGDINWPPHSPQPAEGAMRLWAHHAVAHGGDAVMYFRWRRCREGQEQYHAGLRKQDGSPDRGHADASRAAEELFDLEPVDAPVALLHRYDDLWATSIQPHSPDFDYWDHVGTYYRALRRRGVQVDVIPPDRDPSGYAAVVAPSLHLVADDLADRLESYVAEGGHLLCGIRTGEKDPYNKLPDAPQPGPLADLLGATVDRHETLPADFETRVTYDGDTYDYRTWAERFDPDGATVRGEHTGAVDGTPAIVENEQGAGSAIWSGVWPGADLADALVESLLVRADVERTPVLPDGVAVAERDGYVWVTNFTGSPVSVDLPAGTEWIVGSNPIDGFDVGVTDAGLGAITVDTD
ncbi:beta-galactosidase protein [Halorhabdus tiamatea SARL4B]|uniref:beta-galactosidase n=1 Tax=Halorhabdus tiamatea SARL4B TaxID=1033806 RepID=F7PHK9_9EURY|nr:beta-galactosidase [Halorhabdus tiamatea]ERJ05608.1 beta-galactosidase protein [Halorhabdus tiamatea SARL4B]CCQ34999.1 beta-galactosidase, family GH42 [Halorhabdus tiamatea SARL4B]